MNEEPLTVLVALAFFEDLDRQLGPELGRLGQPSRPLRRFPSDGMWVFDRSYAAAQYMMDRYSHTMYIEVRRVDELCDEGLPERSGFDSRGYAVAVG